MKFAPLLLLCLLFASVALARPKVTEIRLEDFPGYVGPPIPKNEFVFCADGNLYWLEGTRDKPVRHRYSLSTRDFAELVATLETHHFFALKPYEFHSTDAPSAVIRATRGGRTKSYVVDGTHNLWELEMIVRGFASQRVGLRRTLTKSK